MSPSGSPMVVAVLAAAVLHASWNAIAKGVPDRLGIFTRATVVTAGFGVVLACWVAPPQAAAWPWLIGSCGVHVLYNLGLIAAYSLGDFNQVYPLARGLGPLIVALVAVTLLDEPLPARHTLGVILVAGAVGVLGLTPWQRVRSNRPALVAAVLTGLSIASYTLLDGIGVRRSGHPVGYIAWLLGVHAALTVLAIALVQRTRWAPPRPTRPAAWWLAAAAGAMSALAYGLVLWAQTQGALAAVAALRESSVVVAATLGVVFFHEPMGRVRIAASVVVASGVVLLALA